jgi:hypothetical protein
MVLIHRCVDNNYKKLGIKSLGIEKVHYIKNNMIKKILNILRLFFSFLTGVFFFIGALGYIILPNKEYPNFMYLFCSISLLISIIFEIIIFIKYHKT